MLVLAETVITFTCQIMNRLTCLYVSPPKPTINLSCDWVTNAITAIAIDERLDPPKYEPLRFADRSEFGNRRARYL